MFGARWELDKEEVEHCQAIERMLGKEPEYDFRHYLEYMSDCWELYLERKEKSRGN